ncbi:hypothetical protein CHELA1G11_11132 [Hyphomicrobiales bacterium]|nr:hypothetical protein CHELA1G11_11132 [Hyphomicrobiales bacterium]CAH1669913.1 hypothetical protein CHELA1G2_13178 [Hyphomicrobiales bacterium]
MRDRWRARSGRMLVKTSQVIHTEDAGSLLAARKPSAIGPVKTGQIQIYSHLAAAQTGSGAPTHLPRDRRSDQPFADAAVQHRVSLDARPPAHLTRRNAGMVNGLLRRHPWR